MSSVSSLPLASVLFFSALCVVVGVSQSILFPWLSEGFFLSVLNRVSDEVDPSKVAGSREASTLFALSPEEVTCEPFLQLRTHTSWSPQRLFRVCLLSMNRKNSPRHRCFTLHLPETVALCVHGEPVV